MSYGYVYVAQVAMGANDSQTIRAFQEAEAYDGPSIIIAYSHCIAHGIDMAKGMNQQKLAVDSGHWILYRYNPLLRAEGKNPLELDSKAPSIPLKDYAYNETRYRMLAQSNPEAAKRLLGAAQEAVNAHWKLYERMATGEQPAGEAPAPAKDTVTTS
jgi:pyruvate-ferredoxin/flavodoxin oxidoreductase